MFYPKGMFFSHPPEQVEVDFNHGAPLAAKIKHQKTSPPWGWSASAEPVPCALGGDEAGWHTPPARQMTKA